MTMIPTKPENSFRVTLTVNASTPRLDALLMEALRGQNKNLLLKGLSRTAFKELFNKKQILIKGQPAKPSSTLAQGITYVDILGYEDA